MSDQTFKSKHFTLNCLTESVYTCIHQPGGAAYSNAGIIDLGDCTLLVDALNTQVAGRDLRQTAETLFERPVKTIVLTHAHNDHWIGASAFNTSTTLFAHQTTRQICLEWGAELLKEYQDPSEWEAWIKQAEEQLQSENDERVRVGLKNTIIRAQYVMAEMSSFQPRYADVTYDGSIIFHGAKRNVELRSLGRGHSEDDTVLLLLQDGIAFIGDIGFFDTQPFLGFCDIDLYREQLLSLYDANFPILVPGHGPVGNNNDIALQLEYFDVMETMVGNIVHKGGSLNEALHITLAEPFNTWLMGGMERFKINVRYLFEHLGGEINKET